MSMFSKRGSRTYLSLFATTMLALGAACGDDVASSTPSSTTGTNVDDAGLPTEKDSGTTNTGSAPTATAQSVTTTKEAAVSIGLVASDPDGQTVTYAVATQPAHGTLGALDAASGVLTYTPAADFLGEDSFTFTASDGALTSEAAKVTITVTAAGVAVAQAQAVTTDEDTAKEITLVATGGVAPIALTIATQPAHGTLGTLANGKVTYTPAANYAGADTFSFSAKGLGAEATTANVNLTVTAVNDAPVAAAKNVTGYAGAPMQIKLSATDVDDLAPFTFVAGNAVNGTLGAVVGDIVTFTPTAAGPASFTYTADDGDGPGAAATVTLDVKAAGTSCHQLLTAGVVTSGTYPIDLDGEGATYTAHPMFCDQENDGGGWTRVLFHDTTDGFFANMGEAALSNEDDPASKRYSVLDRLEALRGNGGFEFRLDWPLAPGVENVWQQTSNPVTANAGDRVTGYRGVRIDASSEKWGGLEKSTAGNALLDGSVRHGFWWYAVGSVNPFGAGIPAAYEINVGGGTTTQVELWVRPTPTCGDGVKVLGETCDDGNANGGDGCSSTCAVERTTRKTCREILAANESVGDGTYVVDADGAGGADPFSVYCDMTNDGGGWTLVGKVGQGNFGDLTTAEYVALVAEPVADVNTGALTEGTVPGTSTMAFFNRAHTNALYEASGKTVRTDMVLNQNDGNANGLYFQQKVNPPANWDFWAAIRDARMWNDNGGTAGDFVTGFGTQFVLGKGAGQYDPATDTVTHNGDGSFGWWSIYTHALSDNSLLNVSRHGGLLCDGAGAGWQWLLTLDANDARFRFDDGSLAKSRVWLR